MLQRSRGLSEKALNGIAELERRVVGADGGRLKLEWDSLTSRPGAEVEDFLWWDGDRLLGFAGRYGFGGGVEVTGMVDPDARRGGIGSALLDAVAAEVSGPFLLVVPRASAGGKRLALRHGGRLSHSEHALELHGDPTPGAGDPAVGVRPATGADVRVVEALLADAFGHPAADVADQLDRTLVIERNGHPVGTLRVDRADGRADVYAFAVAGAFQGQGIGRQALRDVCLRERAAGRTTVGLEVLVDNDRALGLYRSLGFAPVLVEDYYAVPAPG